MCLKVDPTHVHMDSGCIGGTWEQRRQKEITREWERQIPKGEGVEREVLEKKMEENEAEVQDRQK